MKKVLLLVISIIYFSCGKEKVVLLPEITHSEITEINDVSAAYLFYNETKPDSVELNRKNLISTTNWLVNVDKRLTLKQVIPHIKFLQEKKANSSHKNEKAKNYFTCNDTSRQSLGFVEFTDVVYHKKIKNNITKRDYLKFSINIHSNDSITIGSTAIKGKVIQETISSVNLLEVINHAFTKKKTFSSKIEIDLKFNSNLTFQNYISFKSKLSELDFENIIISNNEFIY